MLRDLILNERSIEVRDLLLEAKEQEYDIKITIGYLEINGFIQEINDNSLVIRSEELAFSVVF